jgi:hypothetical protein
MERLSTSFQLIKTIPFLLAVLYIFVETNKPINLDRNSNQHWMSSYEMEMDRFPWVKMHKYKYIDG